MTNTTLSYWTALQICPTSTNAMMAADLFLILVDGGSFSLERLGRPTLGMPLEEVKEKPKRPPTTHSGNERAKQNKLINDFLDSAARRA